MLRFNHEANSWQVNIKNHRYLKWINISVELARALFDSGEDILI